MTKSHVYRIFKQMTFTIQGGTYLPIVHGANIDESDSDLEDFKDVVDESRKAMLFTQSTLRKQQKDPMDTGILYDPSEYVSAFHDFLMWYPTMHCLFRLVQSWCSQCKTNIY